MSGISQDTGSALMHALPADPTTNEAGRRRLLQLDQKSWRRRTVPVCETKPGAACSS